MAILTISDVRDEGYTDPPFDDPRVTAAIEAVEDYLEQITGNFFEPRTLTLNLDGSGTDVLMMPYPIISIISVKENGEDSGEVELTDLQVYNRHLSGLRNHDQDDRHNPKIEFVRDSFPYIERSYYANRRRFTPGAKNWEIVGVFGYRDYDPGDLVNGKVPPQVKDILLALIDRFLVKKGSPKYQQAWAGHSIKKTKTRTQECEIGGAVASGKLHGGLTGDWYLDQRISMYTRPTSATVV